MEIHPAVVDISGLVHHLNTAEGRVDEVQLLRYVRLQDECDSAELSLFRRHFELYHALHLLSAAGLPGKHVHIGLAHVCVRREPASGECGWFDEEVEDFCRRPSSGGLCEHHSRLHAVSQESGSLRAADARSYYLDRSNLARMDEAGVKRLMDGVFRAAENYEEIRRAAETLGVSLDSTSRRLQERFRHLVKELHPDAGGDTARFAEMYAAYQLLQVHLKQREEAEQTL
ncbi:MAG: DNA-J related domain-containing protein [Spirochaetota bacterium]